MSGHSEPVRANLFHAGNTCPFCQEAIAEGQMVVTCNACGSLHHDTCWEHKGGCSSYHCDEKVSAPAGSLKPDLVLSATELERVVVPPKPARRSADEVARPFLAPRPERLSKMAVVSIVLAVLAAVGLAGFFSASLGAALIVGLVLGLGAIALGVIALVAINMGRKVYGTAPAVAGVLLAAGLVVAYFAGLGVQSSRGRADRVILKMAESWPDEAELSRLPPAQARALRANVVVTAQGGGVFSRGMSYGSGIVVRVDNQKVYILTNRHVIGAETAGAAASRQIDILFYNGEKSRAAVEWTAPREIDLAILSCQALTLTKVDPPELLDALASQGEPVFAVGNPESLPWSYTEGVISSARRQQVGGQEIEVYQTQTPINRGNSGGGLYDKQGRLLGINTWTQDKSVSEGLNFAISTRTLLKVLEPGERRRFLKQFAPPASPAPGGQTPGRSVPI